MTTSLKAYSNLVLVYIVKVFHWSTGQLFRTVLLVKLAEQVSFNYFCACLKKGNHVSSMVMNIHELFVLYENGPAVVMS